jgi:hypothetical protein
MTEKDAIADTFVDRCHVLREDLRGSAAAVKELMQHPIFAVPTDGVMDFGEMKANLMLAYRHLEDAAMRLGKAVQACDGGKSVYPK